MEDFKFLVDAILLEVDKNEDEAFAAVSLNPVVTWAKFILTDDQPNANKQRIPLEEFDNIIKTGIFMPIKMAFSAINDGHEDSFPIGVISHLKKVKNQIMGLAALWDRERPEDIKMIRERYSTGKPLQLSWEMLYSDSSIENGVMDLKDLALKAVTLVGEPAYEGRTPITAIASSEGENQQLPNSVNSNLEVSELEKEEFEAKIAELEATLVTKNAEIATMNEELKTLREYKATIEKQEADTAKFASIKAKFSDAKIDKDEAYFNENKERLLSLEPEVLDFMIQEMVSFSNRNKNTTNSSTSIPPVNSITSGTDVREMANYLKSKVTKKE